MENYFHILFNWSWDRYMCMSCVLLLTVYLLLLCQMIFYLWYPTAIYSTSVLCDHFYISSENCFIFCYIYVQDFIKVCIKPYCFISTYPENVFIITCMTAKIFVLFYIKNIKLQPHGYIFFVIILRISYLKW